MQTARALIDRICFRYNVLKKGPEQKADGRKSGKPPKSKSRSATTGVLFGKGAIEQERA